MRPVGVYCLMRPRTKSRREAAAARAERTALNAARTQTGVRRLPQQVTPDMLYRRIGEAVMTKTLLGRVRGRTIELDENLGMPDGQEVEVQVKILPPALPGHAQMTEGLAKLYAVLGERYDSGHTDTVDRHNEHQP